MERPNCSLPRNVQTGLRSQPASYLMGSGDYLSYGIALEALS